LYSNNNSTDKSVVPWQKPPVESLRQKTSNRLPPSKKPPDKKPPADYLPYQKPPMPKASEQKASRIQKPSHAKSLDRSRGRGLATPTYRNPMKQVATHDWSQKEAVLEATAASKREKLNYLVTGEQNSIRASYYIKPKASRIQKPSHAKSLPH